MGLRTAKRIKELAKEVHINFKKMYLIGNRFTSEMEESLKDEAKKVGIELAGVVPHDDNIFEYNHTGKSLLTLSQGSTALHSLKHILERMGLLS
jgi:CO dehydrogenase maturation factor